MLSLWRITAKVDHPLYGFNQPKRVRHIAERFDTQSNLMLYLAGRKFNAERFSPTQWCTKVIKSRIRGVLYLKAEIHHFKLSVPCKEQDVKSIQGSKGINVDLKVEFIDDLNSKTLATPNTGSSDSAQGLRIEVNYEIQRGCKTVPVKLS
jgi:hypothetical protein